VRSLRRAEPNLSIYVAADRSSHTWNEGGGSSVLPNLLAMPNVFVREVENHAHINGTLNRAMEWMKELGHTHAALFHDDVVFSPLPENRGHISEWFEHPLLERASALSYSHMEAFVPHDGCVEGQPGQWHESEAWWNAHDLESESVWRKLLPGSKTPGYYAGEAPDGGGVGKVAFDDWFIHCCVAYKPHVVLRLGPVGQIIGIEDWEAIGKFDEDKGLIYDMVFAVECVLKKRRPTWAIPNLPFLHLHNQSIGYRDGCFGVWSDVTAAFNSHYGYNIGEFWKEMGYPVT
jgi:hypothetical protein